MEMDREPRENKKFTVELMTAEKEIGVDVVIASTKSFPQKEKQILNRMNNLHFVLKLEKSHKQ